MPPSRPWCALLALAGLLAAPAATAFDKVLLVDGRLLEGELVSPPDAEELVLRLPGADVAIPVEFVEHTYVEDLEGYVPANDREREYLDKGWVLFEDRWMSRTRREAALRERAEADAAAIAALREAQKWTNAREFGSTHFHGLSNCRPEVTDEVAERLEEFYEAFLGAWRIKLAPSVKKQKQRLFLYRDHDDFLRETGQPPGVHGFFDPVDGELHLAHDALDPDAARTLLYHEGTHLLTYLIAPDYEYPRWMDEGMAEYYGTTRRAGRRLEFGALQYGRIAALRHDEAADQRVDLAELLATSPADFGWRHYAAAWSFTHFLMHHARHGKAYRSFYTKLPENKSVDVVRGDNALRVPVPASLEAALLKALRRDRDELEAEWRAYEQATYHELDAGAHHRAGQLALASGGIPDEDAVRLALEAFGRAAAQGSPDPLLYRRYARLLRLGGFEQGSAQVHVQDPDAATAWAMIQRALELDPVDPLNYAEAALVRTLPGPTQDYAQAESLAATARALSPRDPAALARVRELDERIVEARQGLGRRGGLDERTWNILPAYLEGEPVPDQIVGLSTQGVLDRIDAGTVQGDDWIFQTHRKRDPYTGEVVEGGPDPWDNEWVPLETVPVFGERLERTR